MLVFYFRLSLKPVVFPDGFGAIDFDGQPFTRERWLRKYFSETRQFQHRGQEFMFVPAADAPANIPKRLIVGWIARPRLVSERTPPSAGFQPTEHSSWRGALIAIDPTSHDDGQKIAFEQRDDIGKGLSVLSSLASQMRIGDDPRPFDVQIHPIVEEASFWRFAEKHDFQIEMLAFDVSPPNMFGGSDEFQKELRALRDRNRVSRLKSTLLSDTTLDVQQENIREIVNYTELGAGNIKARSVDKKHYNSNAHTRHERIDTEADQPDFWDRFTRWLGERF